MAATQATKEAVTPPQRRATVLVVDDEESFHRVATQYLNGYRLIHVYTGWQAVDAVGKHHIDVVLLDLNLPDATGLQVLEQLRAERDDLVVIMVTAHSGVRAALEAGRRGAFDFVAKSYEGYQHLADHVERALAHRRFEREKIEASARLQWLSEAFALLDRSRSTAIREVVGLARQVAATPLTVLIEGESGVGKEILARYIHAHSERSSSPFVPVNLSAVPPTLLESHLFGHVKGAFTGAERAHMGKFELAEGGTLFLDEVGELEAGAQVKLLRALQEREIERVGAREASPVDVRVIAATNKPLGEQVHGGRFREDLFYRLNVVRLPVPPLRERRDDLPDLVRMLAVKHAVIMRRDAPVFAIEAVEALANYEWPGNVRELENLVMRLVAIHPGRTISADDIPPEYCLPMLAEKARAEAERGALDSVERRPYFLAREQFERYLVRLTVRRCGGDRRAAARLLGVGYSTVKDKLREEARGRSDASDPGEIADEE